MVAELWGLFPRLIVQNINGLLDEALPNALRSLQIYRALRINGLSSDSVAQFTRHVEDFYSKPRSERRKSDFDAHLTRPMTHEVYSLFHLDFRTSAVSERALHDLASWAHHLIRVSKKTTSEFISLEVMTRTLRRLTSPSRFEKASDLDFEDFCSAWKRTVSSLFGDKHDEELGALVTELKWMDRELKENERRSVNRVIETALVPGIYLTQTEIDWTIAVRDAVLSDSSAPEFPLSKGPEKSDLRDLERIARLFTASRTSSHPEIVKNRERIRLTVLDRCDALLGLDQLGLNQLGLKRKLAG